MSNTEIRFLGPGDDAVLAAVAEGVFDGPVREDYVAEFLQDPRHHLVVAIQEGTVVGFASGVHYLHPDKPAHLFLNEVGVAPSHRRLGLGTQLMKALLDRGRELGCAAAWLMTEGENVDGRAFYDSMGFSGTPAGALLFTVPL